MSGETVPRSTTHEEFIESPQTHAVLERRLIGKIKKTATVPDVLNIEHLDFQNTGAVSVTDFKNGQDGQHLYLLGDGNTTLVNGTKIFTNTGANKLLATNRMYHLVKRNGKWYEIN